MIITLSPAKALDFGAPVPIPKKTKVLFNAQAARLIAELKMLAPQEVASLMRLSEKLALLNAVRYSQWKADIAKADVSRQAIFAFNGDVYTGLDAKTLSAQAIGFAQKHLCILSGLYGVLRPLDQIQPYRLEMGSSLRVEPAKNLYQYWSDTVTQYLRKRLQQDTGEQVLVNLASQEYAKVIDVKKLQTPVLECVFQDYKGDGYKVVGLFAKRARGRMARFAVGGALSKVNDLKHFAEDGYAFNPKASTALRFVFQRKQ